MRTLFYTGFFAFFVALLINVPVVLNAQILSSLATAEVSLLPEHPQPGQTIKATVSSASENVRAATIVWLLDEEIQQQKAGGVDFSFTVGGVGSSQTLVVLVKTANGQVLTKTLVIQPSEVTLLWEASTYTPPFYKGRALYSSGSSIHAEAIPNFVNTEGKKYDSSELVYTWSKNGTVLGSESGINASTLITEGPKFFGDYILLVEVATPDGTQLARSAARIITTEPVVNIYESDPLIGIRYHEAIGSTQSFLGTSQFQAQAIPYFMDIFNENDALLDYTWHINNTKVFGIQGSPSLLSIQLSSQENISTRIQVVVDHARHLLQTAQGNFNITFEGSARNSLFGL